MATYATLNSNLQSQCGAQLRTFDKYVGFTVNVYVRGSRSDSGNSYHPNVNSYSTYAYYTQRFEYISASYSLYNNYLDSGIYTGNIIYQQDVIDSISNVVRITVDLVEGRLGYRVIDAYVCHASCHSSCHSSRGRR